jgi:hypothetical protein
MKIKEKIFGLIFIIFLVIFVSGYVLAQEVGKIIAFQGKVDILREGKTPAIEAKINLPVYLKDIIRTKTDSKAEIIFKDGTVIRIAPRSRVDISEYFTDAETLRATIDLPRGKVAAYVSEESTEKIKKAPKVNKFEIKTPITVAGVRGTNYIVAHYPLYSTVTVLTGRVYCYNPQFPEIVVEVTANQMTVIKEGAPPSPPRRVTPKEIEREEKGFIISKEETPKEEAVAKEASAPPETPSPAPPSEPLSTSPAPPTSPIPSEKPMTTILTTTPPITETTPSITGATPLSMDVTLQSIEPAGSMTEAKLSYKVEANRNIVVRYRIMRGGYYSDWYYSDWETVNTVGQNSVYVLIPVYLGWNYQVEIEGTDSYGNTKLWRSAIIELILGSFSGTIITDTSQSSSIYGMTVSALGENKGVAELRAENPIQFLSSFEAGGGDIYSGYWVFKGSDYSENKFTSSFFRLLTPEYLFTGSGVSSATILDEGLKSLITSPFIEVKKLNFSTKFVSDENTSKIYKHDFSDTTARIDAYLGGNIFWTLGSGSLYLIGKINDSDNVIDFTSGYLWYAPITCSSGSLRYSGYAGGRFAQKSDSSYNVSAYIAGIYNDSTNKGIFIGNLSTDGASNVLQLEKRFFMEGENTVKAVVLAEGSIPSPVSPASISDLVKIDSNILGLTISNREGYLITDTNTNDYTFGVGFIGMGGRYSTSSAPWYIAYSGKYEGGFDGSFGAISKGEIWGQDYGVKNVIKGKTYGYFADITGTLFVTGIFVGETVGTFDPISENEKYWQTVTVGVALETAKFLSMAAGSSDEQEKLRKLNIPVVEVGRASFSGSGNNLTVNMDNVVFFSTQSGQKPLLWATANVSGSYTGTPTTNIPVELSATSGASGKINFTPTYWSDNKWAATIANDTAYPITLSGGSYNGQVHMQGAGAGTYGNGEFSGKAAGIVK